MKMVRPHASSVLEPLCRSADELGGNYLNGFEGQHLVLTVLCVPSSLDSGWKRISYANTYNLSAWFQSNNYTFNLMLLIKIVLCSEFP